jgi:hypothetical protein
MGRSIKTNEKSKVLTTMLLIRRASWAGLDTAYRIQYRCSANVLTVGLLDIVLSIHLNEQPALALALRTRGMNEPDDSTVVAL